MAIELIKCETCVAVFPRRGRKRFCSALCADVFHGRRLIGPNGQVITCAVCERRRAVGPQRATKVCHECAPAWAAWRGRNWRETNPEKYREQERRRSTSPARREYHRLLARRLRGSDTTCERCGAPTTKRHKRCEDCRRPLPVPSVVAYGKAAMPLPRPRRRRDRRRRVFIAGWCLTPGCGEPYVVDAHLHDDRANTPKFCSGRCRKRFYRRRVRTQLDPLAVFIRDDFLCYLCGRPVDMKTSVPSPLAPTIDHVIPRARGGTDTMDNVLTAHFIHNSYKRDLTLDEYREPPCDPALI